MEEHVEALLSIIGALSLWAGFHTMRVATRTRDEALSFAFFLAAVVAMAGACVAGTGWTPSPVDPKATTSVTLARSAAVPAVPGRRVG